MVENEIKNCRTCQATVYQHDKESLVTSMLPHGPWENVKVDFLDSSPSGITYLKYSMNTVDEIEILCSTSAALTIPRLDKTFAAYGIPHLLTSDNGPLFNSKEFKDFFQYMVIKHRRITPL